MNESLMVLTVLEWNIGQSSLNFFGQKKKNGKTWILVSNVSCETTNFEQNKNNFFSNIIIGSLLIIIKAITAIINITNLFKLEMTFVSWKKVRYSEKLLKWDR